MSSIERTVNDVASAMENAIISATEKKEEGNGVISAFLACARGDKETVQNFVSSTSGDEINTEVSSESGLRLLHVACYYGHESIVQILQERGAKDARSGVSFKWWTSLHMAAVRGHNNCIKLLNSNWSVILRRDIFNRTPFHLAAYAGNMYALTYMLSKAPESSARAQILDSQGHVSRDDHFGDTPLDEACTAKQFITVRYLLQQGATLLHTDRCMDELVANGTVVLGANLTTMQQNTAALSNSADEKEESATSNSAGTTSSALADPASVSSTSSSARVLQDSGKTTSVKFRRLNDDLSTSLTPPAQPSTTFFSVPPPRSPADSGGETTQTNAPSQSASTDIATSVQENWKGKFEALARLAVDAGLDPNRIDEIRSRGMSTL